MMGYIMVALLAVGAIPTIIGVVFLMYFFAVYAHVSGFLFDVRREGIMKGLGKLVWS